MLKKKIIENLINVWLKRFVWNCYRNIMLKFNKKLWEMKYCLLSVIEKFFKY